MRISAFALTFLAAATIVSPRNSQAQQPGSADLTGRWIFNADYYGTPILYILTLKQDGDKLTGDLGGDKLEGTVNNSAVSFFAKDTEGGSEKITSAARSGDTIRGSAVFIDGSNPDRPVPHNFVATRVPVRATNATPERHDFAPTVFYRQFSASTPPVLTVNPGDTIHTTTVDAGGTDEKNLERVLGGNPETGPFYVRGAAPGDVLVVHFTRVTLNRDWAVSDSFLVGRATDGDLAVKMKDAGKTVRWHLEPAKGIATIEKPGEHTSAFSIPLRPMMGCVGVAPGSASAPPGTGDSGRWGGNMDFNDIVEGATVYLPVGVPGALLYVGDGHAAQGDGELNGNALETSMDVEFAVDIIPNKNIAGPRVESSTHIMAMGLAGSLDDAFRTATSSMADWLSEDYKLTPAEVAEVLGSSAEYKISEVADRNAGVVLKLNKARLQTLTQPAAK